MHVVTVKPGRGTYLRPVTRLVLLLSEGGGTIDQTFAGGGGGGGGGWRDVQDSKRLHQGKKGEADTPPELGGAAAERILTWGDKRKRRSPTHELMYYMSLFYLSLVIS